MKGSVDVQVYKRMRDAYIPARIRTIFLLESPPKSGEYFYNPNGRVTEQLFGAMMRLLDIADKIKNKDEGLRRFQDRGFIIVDASYEPVNNLKGKPRNDKILEGYPALIRDLTSLDSAKKVPLILVKANVCRLMEPRLKSEGFRVHNAGTVIPFPGSGRQACFQAMLGPILREIGEKVH
jgi:hypothetical protein